jgi:hypothetical protein
MNDMCVIRVRAERQSSGDIQARLRAICDRKENYRTRSNCRGSWYGGRYAVDNGITQKQTPIGGKVRVRGKKTGEKVQNEGLVERAKEAGNEKVSSVITFCETVSAKKPRKEGSMSGSQRRVVQVDIVTYNRQRENVDARPRACKTNL